MKQEVQYAEITLRVAAVVPKAARTDDRMNIIHRLCNSAAVPADLELRPSRRDVTLQEVETMEEAAERRMAEAEGEAIAKAERRYERHLEERAGRHLR